MQALQTWYAKRQLDQIRKTPTSSVVVTSAGTHVRDQWSVLLREILEEELPALLFSVDPFSDGGSADIRTDLLRFTPFASRLKDPKSLSSVEKPVGSSQLLGMAPDPTLLRRLFCDDKGLTVMFPPIQLASTAIFYYLKEVAGYNIRPLIAFPHAIEIVDRIANNKARPFDACVLGEAPALRVLNDLQRFKLTYLMSMPSAEQRVLAPIGGKSLPELGYGEYYFIKDRVSTLLEHVEMLDQEGKLAMSSIGHVNREPDQYPDILASGDDDPRIVAWSPHWQVYVKLGLARQVEQSAFLYRNLLFIKGSFVKRSPWKAKLLPVLIRDAWIRLRHRDVRSKTIESMVSDSDLLEAYWRFCGLHRISVDYL